MYSERRDDVLEQMGKGVMVVPSAPISIRNNDVEHEYRQDSDLFYLTGFDEPESVLVLSNVHPEHRAVLFVRPRDPSREVWDGPRAGVDGALRLGVDAAFEIATLDEKLPEYLTDADRLHYRIGRDRAFDDRVLAAIDAVRGKARTGVRAPSEIVDPARILHELRLYKEPAEIEAMRRACDITRAAHLRAMEVARPGVHEFEVEAELLRVFRARGSERAAYGAIVGSGPNATILHYRKNDRRMEEGDLLLIDAGCEHGYYASDVTRTFPVSGTFTEAQRAVYEVVLDSQRAAIGAVEPGATIDTVHDVAVRRLAEGLVRLGIVEGPVDHVLEEASYKPFYMHRTSHWLGMDVHDVGPYFVNGEPRPFGPGMVLTVEPGLYIAPNADVPEQYRGIGIRIEDDILVTPHGHENLTEAIPKDPSEIERAMADR